MDRYWTGKYRLLIRRLLLALLLHPEYLPTQFSASDSVRRQQQQPLRTHAKTDLQRASDIDETLKRANTVHLNKIISFHLFKNHTQLKATPIHIVFSSFSSTILCTLDRPSLYSIIIHCIFFPSYSCMFTNITFLSTRLFFRFGKTLTLFQFSLDFLMYCPLPILYWKYYCCR